jgi:hypothetical protein
MSGNFQQLQYDSWESSHMAKHSELMKKYHQLKEKEIMIQDQKGGKTSRKDILLTQKKNMTITRLGDAELNLLDKEEYVEKNYNRNLQVIEDKKDKAIKSANNAFDIALRILEEKRSKSISDAEDAYEKTLMYYQNEKDSSLSKCKKEFDLRKRTLEEKGDRYDAEKSAVSKTSTEITLDMQKYKILKELKSSIDIMAMSRNSVQNGKFIQPLPTLPEPLPSQAVIQTQEEKPKVNINDWLNSVGEDASLAILRAEARADDARKRKEAEEAEMRREERMLQYRRQLDRDAEQRRWEREQRDKEEIKHQPLTQLQVVSEKEESSDKEEEDEMTQEEMDEYIAKRKLEMKKGFSLKSPA